MTDLAELREAVLEANLALPAQGLVKLTWGNASGVDRDRGLMAIKASGVAYEHMTADDVVLIDLQSGEVVTDPGVTDPAHPRRPSTDTPTHRALYNAFDRIGGIVHTHSTWATAWAQAEQEIPLLGTTHADLMAEAVPLTRPLTADEVDRDYEGETGTVLIELIGERVGRASRGARAWPRSVLLGGDSRRRGHGGGHARGGGPARAAHPAAAPRRRPAGRRAARQAPPAQARARRLLRPALSAGATSGRGRARG